MTDAVIEINDEPPPILQEDPTALLYHARDDLNEVVTDTAEARRRGWRRIVQFGLYFYPSAIDVRLGSIAADLASQPKEMLQLADTEGALPFGIRPWAWARDDRPNVEALKGGLLCAPILQAIILNRFPDETKQWVDNVCEWKFKRVIPCHLANDVAAGPDDFRRAFDFLGEGAAEGGGVEAPAEVTAAGGAAPPPPTGVIEQALAFLNPGSLVNSVTARGARGGAPRLLAGDFALLAKASQILTTIGVIGPPIAGQLARRD